MVGSWLVPWSCRAGTRHFLLCFGRSKRPSTSISIPLSPSSSKPGRQPCWVGCLLVSLAPVESTTFRNCFHIPSHENYLPSFHYPRFVVGFFNEKHRFYMYYEFQPALSGIVCYCITADQTFSLHFIVWWFCYCHRKTLTILLFQKVLSFLTFII